MTVIYISGKRLNALSTDTLPETIQTGTIATMTDTGIKYWYDGIKWKVFNNIYESFAPLTTINKQHFVEWFSGDGLDTIWTQVNTTGTGTFAMADEIDGGYSVKCGITSGNDSGLSFNTKRQYAHNASEIILIAKRIDSACGVYIGTSTASFFTTTTGGYACVKNVTTDTYYGLLTSDDSVASTINSDIAIDTSWHNHKLIYGSSNIKLYTDGVLRVTKTTNRPTAKQQPCLEIFSSSAGAKECRIRYYEVYNT